MRCLGRREMLQAARRNSFSAHRSCRLFSVTHPHRERTKSVDLECVDVEYLLTKHTWSVASLLPSGGQNPDSSRISSKQLHHLLRLSALPAPKNAQEEAKMLSTLSSQLHFVKDIQKVDTTDVEPLRSLRDETKGGERDEELDREALKDALAQEEIKGKFHKRIRRRRDQLESSKENEWDALGTTGTKVGRYFVVEGGKGT